MMGPVQEKLTSTSVKAMRKTERKPVVWLALLSTLPTHEEGSVRSKPPTKETPKSTSMRKKRTLKKALVARSLSAEAPKAAVTVSPSVT